MALNSMTGFGKASRQADVQVDVELKSINHRYLDLSFKLPQLYSSFELDISKTIRDRIQRGRVEAAVIRIDPRVQATKISFNRDLFTEYLAVAREALQIAGVAEPEGVAQAALGILQKREVLESPTDEIDVEKERILLFETLSVALDDLIGMRAREGEALLRELRQQLRLLQHWKDEIGRYAVTTPELFRERLSARLQKLSPNLSVEPERLAQEVALLADRIDITEELARLQSHIEQFQLLSADGNGKKLEFLLQEMGREINTAGTKAQNADIAKCVIEAKAVIEKIREQVQNVE